MLLIPTLAVVGLYDARCGADGSCRLVDQVRGTEVVWASQQKWASDWFAERRVGESGAACDFARAACDDAVPGVVEALIALAETAGGDEDLLSMVGAGPIEDLVSHSGNGVAVLPAVDRAARRNIAFRAALRFVWVGADLPTAVKVRLVELGARALDES